MSSWGLNGSIHINKRTIFVLAYQLGINLIGCTLLTVLGIGSFKTVTGSREFRQLAKAERDAGQDTREVAWSGRLYHAQHWAGGSHRSAPPRGQDFGLRMYAGDARHLLHALRVEKMDVAAQ